MDSSRSSLPVMPRPQYRFSVGMLDWLFGKRALITLPHGQFCSVTMAWLKEMENAKALERVPPFFVDH